MAWLGQKSDTETASPTETVPRPRVSAAPIPSVSREKTEISNVANIGKSLFIKGELTGSEDLAIEGKVEGRIALQGHKVTIGETGRVTAEIQAKAVVVGGQVKGNITADERVELAATGAMVGDVRAPRVVLADGAQFKGSIDMDPKASPGKYAGTPATTATNRPAEDDAMAYIDRPPVKTTTPS